MTYAKRILSILLVFCVLLNLSTAVFARDSDELPLAETAVEEAASEEPVMADKEASSDNDLPPAETETTKPAAEALPGIAEPDAGEPTEAPEAETAEPTEPEETIPSSEIADEDATSDAPDEAAPVEEATEESTELVAEETTAPPDEEAAAPEEMPDAESKASGVPIIHGGDPINTNGTLTISYYNYLEGVNKTAHIQAIDLKTINGAAVYCLAPEMNSDGKNYTIAAQNAAWIKLPRVMREAIGLVLAYGYPNQSYKASPNDIYWYGKQSALNTENYIATQLIIWEILSGVRSNTKPYALTGSTSYRNAVDSGWATIRSTYDSIVAKMAKHNDIPAYASRSQNAYVYELQYNSATGTYRYMLPAERQSDWRECQMTLPDGIKYLKAADGMTVTGFEATAEAAKALPAKGYTVSGESPYLSVDADTAVVCWTCTGSQTVATMAVGPDPAKAYFTLKANVTAELEIIKTSPNGNVANITFILKDANGKEVDRGKTDAKGKLVLQNLSVGQTYTVTEVVPDGWICEQNNQKITIQAGANKLTFVNKRLDLNVVKQSPDGKVEGVSFQLFAGDENYQKGIVWKTVTTGKNGAFTVEGIKTGVYWVREIVPAGYAAQEDQKITVTEANTSDNPAVVTFVNVPLSVLKIVKQSPDGNVANITFNVYQGDADYQNKKIMQTVVSGADGTIQIDKLTAGAYWIEELVLEDYEEQKPQRIEVTMANTKDNPAIVTFVNKPLSALRIIKESEDGNVENITFNIYAGDEDYKDGTIFKTVVTGKDGTIQIDKLTAGVYWVQEIVLEGYIAQKDRKVTITENHTKDNPAVVTFWNIFERGTITIEKVNTSGEHLKDAVFLLEYSTDGGATWNSIRGDTDDDFLIGTCTTLTDPNAGTITTSSDGFAIFDDLIVYGVMYRVTEIQAPPGYQLLVEPVFVGELTNDGNSGSIYREVVNSSTAQMPPTGGAGNLRLICAVATVLASASLLALSLLLRKRKGNE